MNDLVTLVALTMLAVFLMVSAVTANDCLIASAGEAVRNGLAIFGFTGSKTKPPSGI
jgi:hypothetical protein